MYACNDMELFSRFLCLSLDPRKYGKGVDVWSCGVPCRIIEDVTYNLYKQFPGEPVAEVSKEKRTI